MFVYKFLPKEGAAGVGFDGTPEVEDCGFFTSVGSARLCLGPSAIKSPENPRGFDLELLGGKFLPRSILTTSPAEKFLNFKSGFCYFFFDVASLQKASTERNDVVCSKVNWKWKFFEASGCCENNILRSEGKWKMKMKLTFWVIFV